MPSERDGDGNRQWEVPLMRHQRVGQEQPPPPPLMSRPEEQTPGPAERNRVGRLPSNVMAMNATELLAGLVNAGSSEQADNENHEQAATRLAASYRSPNRTQPPGALPTGLPAVPHDGELASRMNDLRLPSPVLGRQANSTENASAATPGPPPYRYTPYAPLWRDGERRQGRGPGGGHGSR